MIYDVHGQDGSSETVLLSSGLGGSAAYWAPQMDMLCARFRVVTYDHRGTGRTGGTVPPAGGITAMVQDVLDIADALNLTRFHMVGHALGGLIGLQLALDYAERIDKLVVVNGWSKVDPHSGRCFDARIALLENSGVEAFIKAQPLFLYPAVWMSDNQARMNADDVHGVQTFQGKQNILARIAALRTFDIDKQLADIKAKTLIMATRDDLLVPYTRSHRLHDGIPNSQLWMQDFGGHAVNVTSPNSFNDALAAFL
ncbi:pyrimidine utilization protein D [Rhizobium sp. CFBP 8762]|uniref:pyrimidine utilization protein D n=1 Tax=Rhizobium sp. CFBP 8762 TaxID=2775279 RepID=UPI00177BFDD9|nr:pyrimidine utilization protein D [Rhizobium sp. CFBP 8762]MBD8554108.1 pyrimidine utilization protein D [Rhizobium sp. CFBP 8762]